jgi:membrane protease YdiL (CAAX protease family)
VSPVLPAVPYVVAAAGVAIVAVWSVRARRGDDPLGAVPAGPLPDTGLAVFLAVPAWFLSTLVLGAVARAAGLSGPGLATAAGLVHTTIGLVLLPMVRRGAPAPTLGPRKLVIAGTCAGLATYGVVAVVAEVVRLGYVAAGTAPPEQEIVAIARSAQGLDWAAMLATGVVLAPFGEEVFWRGALLPALARATSVPAAVLLQGFAFGAAHFLLGAPMESWPLALPVSVVGICAGWVYVRTASLPAAFLVHAVFNGLNLLFLRMS